MHIELRLVHAKFRSSWLGTNFGKRFFQNKYWLQWLLFSYIQL